ncbi:fibrinogen C domain-containing protein 1-B-like isoform 2-T2 [Syngnathus typhle]
MELVVVKPETAADVPEGPTVSEDAGQADNSMLNDNWAQMNKHTEKLLGPKKRWSFLRHALPMVLGVAVLMLTVIILYWITRVRVVFKESDTVVTASQAILDEAPGNFLDPNCTDLACRRRKALDASSLVPEMLQAVNVSNGKEWKELRRELSEEHAGFRNFTSVFTDAVNSLSRQNAQLKGNFTSVFTDAVNSLSRQNAQQNAQLKGNFTSVFTDALAFLRKDLDSLSRQSAHLKALLKPRDCSEVKVAGNIQDGVYTIYPGSNSVKVYCDMTSDGGGWTVFQRRKDGSVNFHRAWDQYRDGFGDITGEHWLGLRHLNALTGLGGYQFRVDAKTHNGHVCWTGYNNFSVGLNSLNPENDGYPLRMTGWDSRSKARIGYYAVMGFSTYDRDQDTNEEYNLANMKGAWWHNKYPTIQPNGIYYQADRFRGTEDGRLYWSYCNYDRITFMEMKVRPAPQKNK